MHPTILFALLAGPALAAPPDVPGQAVRAGAVRPRGRDRQDRDRRDREWAPG